MGDNSAIEWTDATWNPTVGCSIVSPGCTNCYAMRVAWRLHHAEKYAGLTRLLVNGNPVWTGDVRLDESALDQPLRWRRPRRIFVNSMSDLFHEALEIWQIAQPFAVMACAQQHQFQVLTKRAARMRAMLSSEEFWDHVNAFAQDLAFEHSDSHARRTDDYRAIGREGHDDEPLPNVWLGISAERQLEWDARLGDLGATPAAVRFVSVEPMLEAIDVGDAFDPPFEGSPYQPIDWVICGGESGKDARPMHPDWARSLRDQCQAAGVPFFFKQWGEWLPTTDPRTLGGAISGLVRDNPEQRDIGAGVPAWRVGKKRAGRLLDGREWNEFPGGAPPWSSPGAGQ